MIKHFHDCDNYVEVSKFLLQIVYSSIARNLGDVVCISGFIDSSQFNNVDHHMTYHGMHMQC